MISAQHTSTISAQARIAAKVAVGLVMGGCALGLAGHAGADPGNCDDFSRSMTPQMQFTACDAPPPPEAPADNVMGPDAANANVVPPPGDPVLPPAPQMLP
jgi:hypothetical protein